MSINNLNPWAIPGVNPVNTQKSRDLQKLTKLLKHKHMVEFIERYEWTNLPDELNADLIERILFFRYKGAFFQFADKFWFLPFTLKGTIDSYGRYESITPVLFTGQFDNSNQKNQTSAFLDSNVLDKTFIAAYSKGQEMKANQIPAIILTDSSLEVSQDFTPQNDLITPLIEQLVDILVLVNIDLVTSAKVFYIVAKDQAQKDAIQDEFEDLDYRILSGKRVVVVTSELELQELTGSQQAKDQARYFQTYQSFDNLRKDIIGMSNSGQFMKQEHMTETESQVNSSSGSSILENGLRLRKEFADLINHFYSLDIQVEIKGNNNDDIVADEGAQTKDRRGDDNDVV